jgi:hypothetical protein
MSPGRGLIAFDIDGTLEVGEPPGPVPLAMVRRAQELGYLVGSCSDRPAGWQRMTWEQAGIAPDFVVLKHLLERVHSQHEADEYVHVAVSERDRHYAELAGFGFASAYDVSGQPWAVDASGAPIPAADTSLSASERARIEAAGS